jgi:hypothetical protein
MSSGWSLFMWAMVRFLATGSTLGSAVWGDEGVGWLAVAGVLDRERARAAAEERVVTMLAVGYRWVIEGAGVVCG